MVILSFVDCHFFKRHVSIDWKGHRFFRGTGVNPTAEKIFSCGSATEAPKAKSETLESMSSLFPVTITIRPADPGSLNPSGLAAFVVRPSLFLRIAGPYGSIRRSFFARFDGTNRWTKPSSSWLLDAGKHRLVLPDIIQRGAWDSWSTKSFPRRQSTKDTNRKWN